jgi:hypothetical protein
LRENWISACRKVKLDLYLSPCTSINSKWIKDLYIRPETLKLVRERGGNTLELISIDNEFLSGAQMAQQLKERIDKWEYMKLKSFCTMKINGHQIEEATYRMGENICQLYN